jgi:hypothetical protein
MVVLRSAAITWSTTSSGSSTSENVSAISMAPMPRASIPDSFAIAPTRSAGRMFAFRPAPT